MAFDFPSAAWTDAYKDAINANANYKVAGKDWTHGAVAMVVKAEPSVARSWLAPRKLNHGMPLSAR